MKRIGQHFTRIASRYRQLRITDGAPVLFIKRKVRHRRRLIAADVGCGAGRYDLLLFQHLGKRLFLYCIDTNNNMLSELKKYLCNHRIDNFKTIRAEADKIPLADNSLDAIFTFNAIHHFDLLGFLANCSRVLKNRGYLFIYTRLRRQNRHNIWGKYFPSFYEKETRLYDLKWLKMAIRKTPGLNLESCQYFKYARLSSLNWLVEHACAHHYSTFTFYSQDEFQLAVKEFICNIQENFYDINQIRWFDENILLVIKKLVK